MMLYASLNPKNYSLYHTYMTLNKYQIFAHPNFPIGEQFLKREIEGHCDL